MVELFAESGLQHYPKSEKLQFASWRTIIHSRHQRKTQPRDIRGGYFDDARDGKTTENHSPNHWYIIQYRFGAR